MKYNKEGWQCFVQIDEDKVIKRIKTKEEMFYSIRRHLEANNKLDKLEERVDKINLSMINSLRIIQESKIPRKYIANANIQDNIIEQDKVILLGEKINGLIRSGNEKEAKRLIEYLIDFIITLWNYKIHENTYKFYSCYGIDKNNNIVLIDFLEITDDREKVTKQIMNKKWNKPERYFGKIDKKISDYFIELANKKLTLKTFQENWRLK